MTLLGLAECGLAGWLLKKPLSVNVICPAGMNPAEDFAVMATGQSLALSVFAPPKAHRAWGHRVRLKTQQHGQFGVGARIRAQGERKQDTLAGVAEMARFRPKNGAARALHFARKQG